MRERVIYRSGDPRGLGESPRLSLNEVLGNLAIEQKREEQGFTLKQEDVNSRRVLVRWYKGTKSFREVYDESINFTLTPHSEKKSERFMNRLAGRAYEDIAYQFLAVRQPDYLTLLSPQKTLEFYKKLYPNASVDSNGLGLVSLRGISVPDGLLVGKFRGRSQVFALCDYTLTGDTQYFKRHAVGFQKDKRHFPQLFTPYPYHLFIVPNGATSLREKYPHAKIEQLPFTHKQFRDFIDGIYSVYQSSDDAATLPEVKERMEEQLARAKEHLNTGKITPEEDLYLFNIDPS